MSSFNIEPRVTAQRLEELFRFLESDSTEEALSYFDDVSQADLLRLMVGGDADTKQLLLAPEDSKYPVECSRIKQVSHLKSLRRLIVRTKRLTAQADSLTPISKAS